MIHQSDLSWQTQSWQDQMKTAISSPAKLLETLEISETTIALSRTEESNFPLLVPLAFIARMKKGDSQDPLLKQVLCARDEDTNPVDFESDPLQEDTFNPLKGLIRKYKNRALLMVTGKCAINCRYCFRREFPYPENNPSRREWLAVKDYIAENNEIDEIIFSGGDPLSASDNHLRWLVELFSEVDSVKRLRFHTRLPVVIPSRVTDELLSILESTRLTTTVVLHINHANEINEQLRTSILRLKTSTNFLLNQSVLLRGINDDLDSQIALQQNCADAGVQPYYLHILDKVRGAAHFQIRPEEARALYEKMRTELSGYMLPRLVVEIPGRASKTAIG